MSTLIGIKRPSEHPDGPISVEEIDKLITEDSSLDWEGNGQTCLIWRAKDRTPLMFFNVSDGEIWSAGSPDAACLKKIQILAERLDAKAVDEGRHWIEPEDIPGAISESATKGSCLFRLYILALLGAGIAWFVYSR